MSTIVDVDFSAILPRGSATPHLVLADVIELGSGGADERLVREGVIINLRRGQPQQIDVSPGTFLIRLQASTGQVLMRQVQVRDEGRETSLLLVPAKAVALEPQLHDVDDRSSRIVVGDRLPRSLTPPVDGDEDGPSRARWAARRLERTGRSPALNYLPGLPVREVVNERQDFMGVAKLKASPRNGAFRESSRGVDPSSYLVGDIDAVQAARLYGQDNELQTQWKYPLRSTAIIGAASDEGRGGRYFALSYRATNTFSPLQVACMPGRWVLPEGGLAPIRASYSTRYVGGDVQRALRLEVDDPELGGLIEFLQQGDLSGSLRIVGRALELLYAKWRNPYASAVAGYVLIQAGLTREARGAEWTQWLLNLASRYRALPDGAILYTTLLLQGYVGPSSNLRFDNARSPFTSELGSALEAIGRGPPLFRYGLKLMATNLAILEDEARGNDASLRELASARNYVQELSLRVDPDQPFCVFDVDA